MVPTAPGVERPGGGEGAGQERPVLPHLHPAGTLCLLISITGAELWFFKFESGSTRCDNEVVGEEHTHDFSK